MLKAFDCVVNTPKKEARCFAYVYVALNNLLSQNNGISMEAVTFQRHGALTSRRNESCLLSQCRVTSLQSLCDGSRGMNLIYNFTDIVCWNLECNLNASIAINSTQLFLTVRSVHHVFKGERVIWRQLYNSCPMRSIAYHFLKPSIAYMWNSDVNTCKLNYKITLLKESVSK